MKKFSEWPTKQKITLGVVTAGILIGGATSVKAYDNHQYKQQVVEAKKELQSEVKDLQKLSTTVESLRDKKNPNFLTKEVTLAEIETIESSLEGLKKNHQATSLVDMKKLNQEVTLYFSETSNQIKAIEFQLTSQEEVNKLFSSDKESAIVGDSINNDLPIADDLTIAQIETVVKNTKDKDMLTILPSSTDENKSWEQAITGLTDKAMEQAKQIEDVSKKVTALFKDDKPIETTDSKVIQDIQKQIDSIKNEKAKKELSAKLKQVSDVVSKKEETKAKEEKAKSNATSNNGTSTGTNSNNNTTNNQSQGTDSNTYSDNSYSDNGSGDSYTPSTGGGYTPPANNGGGGGSSSNGNGSSDGGWTGQGDQTGGGEIDPGEAGSGSWTGGEFDGSGIPEW